MNSEVDNISMDIDTNGNIYEGLDVERIINNIQYRTFMAEYHSFIAYVLQSLNTDWYPYGNRYGNPYGNYQCNMKINKHNIFYEEREKMLEMIKNTFYLFDVSVQIIDDDYFICVNWQNYIASI